MPANPTTTRAEKALPRARVMQSHSTEKGLVLEVTHRGQTSRMAWQGGDTQQHCAVIPCLTRAQAARIARVANMAGGERVTLARDAYFGVTNNPTDPDAMVAVLSALGLATGGKA